MNPLSVAVPALCFVAQLFILYSMYIHDAPKISLITGAGYTFCWAYLVVTRFFELRFTNIGLMVLLAILLPLTVVSVRRHRQDDRTQSA